ncbi:hypothetical protein AGRA3207_001246 [Actinomadura graeca]|uniref:Uncharacterized protein n=1 Tax=Actinomadura graeca TaxID=2750812 RepID=A0ABX8QP16_9ACTN|nr:hypothetical protein [Actinomadura graeca]QXJ20518.1 hypothetical protein AGRA3207_001246 [Actinomadura graeca]
MGRRLLAVLGGLMMSAGALAVVAPVSLGVAPASTTLRSPRDGGVRPVPIRSLSAPAAGAAAPRSA